MPKDDLDEKLIKQLAMQGNTLGDIAHELGFKSTQPLQKYRDLISAGRAAGRKAIRQMMWAQALKGNLRAVGMLASLHLRPDEVDSVDAEFEVIEQEEIGVLLEQAGCKD